MYFKINIEPQTECCYNCENFRQHYTRDGDELYCGHCVYPRMKNRGPFDTCQHFLLKQPVALRISTIGRSERNDGQKH